MKKSKNKNAQIYLFVCISISIIFIIIMSLATHFQNKAYINEINKKITEIIGEVKSQYPELDDESIIKILNETSEVKTGEEILKQYGITEEVSAIEKVEQISQNAMLMNVSIVLFAVSLIILLFWIYLKQRERNIDKLDKYIQKISRRDYSLDIEESSEDELNALKNSLYKITVLLKEEAENKREQNEAILTSVSDISHQLKTSLTCIQILLDNILESNDMDANTRKKFILETSRQIKGINFFVLSLLKLSKLDAKVVDFEKEPINIKKMVDEILSNLEVLIEFKEIKIIKKIPSNLKIIGDYNWNKEAILNIVKNAVEHTKENKTITIEADENDVYTSIIVKDEGEGIEEKDLKHIFERFYKAKGSNENSIGIGLSLAKSIVEKQNGYISVESEINKGTNFTIKYLK